MSATAGSTNFGGHDNPNDNFLLKNIGSFNKINDESTIRGEILPNGGTNADAQGVI